MLQVRNNVFETNSSSTHSICISKRKPKISSHIHFGFGEFGWQNDAVNPADYLYTAIMSQNEHNELFKKLTDALDKNGVEYDFEEPLYDRYGWLDVGYIDHSEDLYEFINDILNDEDMLMRFLFNDDSVVYTGNDNQDADYSGCDIASKYIYDYNTGEGTKTLNPYHDEERFDYFYK